MPWPGIGQHHRVFQHESPEWNRRLAKANKIFAELPAEGTAVLPPGMMWFWARDWLMLHQKEDGVSFKDQLIVLSVRPRVAQHGGGTR